MADTIREFLIGFGFKLDEAGERRFVSMIEGATLRANVLADAIENMARVVVDKVAVVAENFEQLYYQSQRIGASANSIEAFAFTVHKLGGTVEGAKSSLQGFGDFLNNHIGAAGALAKQLGIPLKDTADRGLFLLEVGEKLSKMPKYLATQYRETFHLGDYDTITKAGLPGAHEIYTGDIKNRENSGIGEKTAKDAVRLEQALKDLNEKLDIYYTQAESSLFKHSANMIEELNKYLENHKKKISEFVDWLTNLGLFSDAGKTSLHFDEKKFGEHFEKALAAAETATVNELKHLEDALHPVVEWFERFGRTLAGWFTQPHLNPDGTPEMLGGGGEGGGGGGSWWSRHAPRWLGGGGAPSGIARRGAAGVPYVAQAMTEGTGITQPQYDAFRAGIRDIEGGQYGKMGGAGGRYAGAYQMGPNEIRESAMRLGLDPDDSQKKFLSDPALQERLFENYTREHYNQLMRDPAFASLSPADKLAVLGAGQLGVGAARSYLHGGGSSDGWGTPTSSWANAVKRRLASSASAPVSDGGPSPSHPATTTPPWRHFGGQKSLSWDQGPAWNNLNASLPVGGSTTNDNSKAITSSVTNNVTVNAPDPHSAAAMVGLHLDRSANDLARNLQGAHQ